MFTDAYVIQSLLEGTLSNKIIWEAKEKEGFVAHILNGEKRRVRLQLVRYSERSGDRHCLLVSSRGLLRLNMPYTCSVLEPQNTGFFGKSFTSPDAENVSRLICELYRASAAQCAGREPKSPEDQAQARQAVIKELLL